MIWMTDRARSDLEAYLARVREAAAGTDVDREDVVEGVREHVEAALTSRSGEGAVTAAELGVVLERLGEPARWLAEGPGQAHAPPAPAGGHGGPEAPRASVASGEWRAAVAGAARGIGRIVRWTAAALAALWPLALVWSSAQRGGALYEWIPGGTPWSGFRPPAYWGRIAAVGAAALGLWWLVLAAALALPPVRRLRPRLRDALGFDPARAFVVAGGSLLLLSLLGLLP